jgi:hypothetical protein
MSLVKVLGVSSVSSPRDQFRPEVCQSTFRLGQREQSRKQSGPSWHLDACAKTYGAEVVEEEISNTVIEQRADSWRGFQYVIMFS